MHAIRFESCIAHSAKCLSAAEVPAYYPVQLQVDFAVRLEIHCPQRPPSGTSFSAETRVWAVFSSLTRVLGLEVDNSWSKKIDAGERMRATRISASFSVILEADYHDPTHFR